MEASKINIVRLDGIYCPMTPQFSFPNTYTDYPTTSAAETASRIQGADVLITTKVVLDRELISQWTASSSTPKLIAAFAIGVDHLDLAACKEYGVTVCNVPTASNEAVAEHAIALFFAARRNVVTMHDIITKSDIWTSNGSAIHKFSGGLPRTTKSEVMTIIGSGDLGKKVAAIGKALGMTVVFADRKGVKGDDVRQDRVEFSAALKQSTIVMVTCVLNASTRDMIGEEELQLMQKDAILVNVARGGIVNEKALVKGLKNRWIAGAAIDVFDEEPAGFDTPLVAAIREDSSLNLTLSPHVAWYAITSIERLQQIVPANIEAFVAGNPQNRVI